MWRKTTLWILFASLALIAVLSSNVGAQTGPDKGQPPKSEKAYKTVESKIKSFTMAPVEQVDGAILEDGTITFKFTMILNKGDRVQASGWVQKDTEGKSRMEVGIVRNLTNGESAVNDKAAPPPKK
jgi:hypothetical protein